MTTLTARLRVGYPSGGIATGAFGTVPGRLLLPYLTDSLGISALVAGMIVFLPKAWDVILNPITGRVSDRFAAAHGTRRTGANRVGVFTGVWTAGETLGLALGPAIYALVLALGGYRSSTGGSVEQPPSAVLAITWGFSLVPALLVLISLLWIRGYVLTREDVEADGRRPDQAGTRGPAAQ